MNGKISYSQLNNDESIELNGYNHTNHYIQNNILNYETINHKIIINQQSNENDSNITKCNVLETSFNLISLITGSGLLALPYAASIMGYSSVFLFIIIAAFHMYTLFLIGLCINLVETKYLNNSYKLHDNIDYLTLGIEAFGEFGGLLVAISLSFELLLAIVSFFINIGYNFIALDSSLHPIYGIIFATVLSLLLCSLHLKYAAYSSAFGVMMNSLIIGTLLITANISNRHNNNQISNISLHYSILNPSGVPMSLGLMAFCFGGHGASPGIYSSMEDKNKYKIVLLYSSIVVISIYLSVMIIGYISFGQYTNIPVTLNIGKELDGSNIQSYWINGKLLRSIAAVGIIFNLQVTSPLVTYPIREILFKTILSTKSLKSILCNNLHIIKIIQNELLVAWFIIIIACIISISLRNHFSAVCGFIGALVTTINSIILPILFYHNIYKNKINTVIWIMHILIIILFIIVAILGVSSAYNEIMM